MMLTRLVLENFRNFRKLQLDLPDGPVIISGNNGQGKTNILESVHYLSTAGSFRSKDENLVHHAAKNFLIAGDFLEKEIKNSVSAYYDKNRKILKINNTKTPQVAYIGRLTTVLFRPEDVELVVAEPARRRRFLDELISQLSKDYRIKLHNYRRVLSQRNQLLFKIREGRSDLGELEIWNMSLIQEGSAVIEGRLKYISMINELLHPIFKDVTGDDRLLLLNYASSFAINGDISASFYKSLYIHGDRDLKEASTTIGPHRDDFEFVLSGRRVADYGSRGEFRAAVLTLKVGELCLIQQKLGSSPILLLDDVFSEFDDDKKMYLMSVVKKHQTLITSAEDRTRLLPQFKNLNGIHLSNGVLTAA